MSNDSMGNLEKLGILVIVILVVVVGVVAITPSETLFGNREAEVSDLDDHLLEPLPLPEPEPAPGPVAEKKDEPLPPWPLPEPVKRTQLDPAPLPEPAPVPEPLPGPQREVKPVDVTTPSFREVTVRKGDSLWSIAERELGNGGEWKRIAAANPSVDPDRLRENQVLRIPVAGETAPDTRRESTRTASSTTPAGGVRTYVVQSGDTPMGLSSKFYGTTKHHRELMQHNGIADPNQLRKGMTIEVPALGSAAPVRSGDPGPTSVAPVGAAPGERTYQVKRGETLSDIAREQLHDAGRWREIMELNGFERAEDLPADARIRLPR